MTVYPEKTNRGYTGVWIVEKTVNGVRTRDRFPDHASAMVFDTTGELPQAPQSPQLTLGDLYTEALPRLWAEKKDRRQSERRLLSALKRLGMKRRVSDIDYDALEALADELQADGLCGGTCNRYLSAVSKLLTWAVRAKKIDTRPEVPRRRENKGRQAWLPEEMTEPFLRTIAETSGPMQAFAAEVLLLSGMRVSELLTLEPHEVVGDVIELSKTKTDFPRSLPIPQGYGDLVRVFASKDHSTQYAYRKLNLACTRASEILGLFPKVTPHILRHSVATRLIKEGVPTVTVARIMGHKSLNTTERYVHHEVSTLRAAMVPLMSGTRGAMALQSKLRAKLETPENIRFSGGLGGNRTPVQGFAVSRKDPQKPTK